MSGLLPRALLLLAIIALCAGQSFPTWYSCNPNTCVPASGCMCPSDGSPGGLAVADTPQFVLFTHDDTVDMLANDVVRKVTDGFKNSNGCNVPATWFVTESGSDCALLQKLHADNHELACHTVHHPPLVIGYPDLEQEMLGVRTWMNTTCGIPLEDMLGFRSPYLVNNPPQRAVLEKNGMLYDSSIEEFVGPDSYTTKVFGERLWPYTMDNGVYQACNWTYPDGQCTTTERYKGLWEIPMWDLPYETSDTEDNSYTMDPGPGYGGTLYTTLSTDFDEAYNGNRAPFPIYIHAPWMSVPSNSEDTIKFVQYALSKPNVFFVTMQQLIKWMENPVPASQVGATLTCNPVNLKPPVQLSCQLYTVQANDYLDGIAGDFGFADDTELLALNPGVTDNNLQPGQILKIPPFPASCGAGTPAGVNLAAPAPATAITGTAPAAATTTTTAPAAAPVAAAVPSPAPLAACQTWTVQAGQTLDNIAASTKSAATAIAQASGLVSVNDMLSIGQVLKIPPYADCCATNSCSPPTPAPAPAAATPVTQVPAPVVQAPAAAVSVPPSRAVLSFYFSGMGPAAFESDGRTPFVNTLAQMLDVSADNITAKVVSARRRVLLQAPQTLAVDAQIATDEPVPVYQEAQLQLANGEMVKMFSAIGLTLQGPPVTTLYQNGTALALPASSATPSTSPGGKKSVSAGVIIGAAVGGAVLLAAVVTGTVLLCKRRGATVEYERYSTPIPAALSEQQNIGSRADIAYNNASLKGALDADRFIVIKSGNSLPDTPTSATQRAGAHTPFQP